MYSQFILGLQECIEFLNDFGVDILECPLLLQFPSEEQSLTLVVAAASDLSICSHVAQGLLKLA